MKNMIFFAVICGIIGLVIGYYIFAKTGNDYIPVERLLGIKTGFFNRVFNSMLSVDSVRQNILLTGLGGALGGLVLSFMRKKGK